MTDLAPCPSCRRHVRIDERACPFCAAALPELAPRTIARGGRLSRAAVFAGASLLTAACGGKAQPADPVVGNTAVDAGADQVAPDAEPYVDEAVKMPYGAPPMRTRVV
jgi:hypothetical protein